MELYCSLTHKLCAVRGSRRKRILFQCAVSYYENGYFYTILIQHSVEKVTLIIGILAQ